MFVKLGRLLDGRRGGGGGGEGGRERERERERELGFSVCLLK